MKTVQERVDICVKTKKLSAGLIRNVLSENLEISEAKFRDLLHEEMKKEPEIYEGGWYEPPPFGIGVLFSKTDDFARLQYDTLREGKFWPGENHVLKNGSVGLIYLSPVNRETGIIGEFGTTIYLGKDEKIKKHLGKSLNLLEKVAGYVEVGMEFRELHNSAQKLFVENGLNNERTVTYTDKVGTNLGHTIPWTHEEPTSEEVNTIKGGNFKRLKGLISSKRINVNGEEKFKIPENIAFTVEVRLEDSEERKLPLVFFHLIVAVKNGKKNTYSYFGEIFKLLEMDKYMGSN
ncbi:MAG: M24 family metallopeptidase [Candidatus Woykebacteria bacterium]